MNEEQYTPEESSAPRNFVLRCPKCRWARITSGLKVDLEDLTYIEPTCVGCGKFRQYRCPKCGAACPLKRMKGNS
jgi:hypothetical protein